MKEGCRLRFLIWLSRKVLKIPLGQRLPKYLIVLQAIMFPVNFFCWTQKTMRYDMARDCIWIDGKQYDRFMFVQMAKVGNKFEIISVEGGIITLKDIK